MFSAKMNCRQGELVILAYLPYSFSCCSKICLLRAIYPERRRTSILETRLIYADLIRSIIRKHLHWKPSSFFRKDFESHAVCRPYKSLLKTHAESNSSFLYLEIPILFQIFDKALKSCCAIPSRLLISLEIDPSIEIEAPK